MAQGSFLTSISHKSLAEAFFTIGGRFISIFLVIGATKFLTTFLSEADYGTLALYNITATLPNLLFFAPLGQGIGRYYPIAQEKAELPQFDRQFTQLFRSGSAIAGFAGLMSAVVCFCAGSFHWAIASLLIAALSVLNAYNAYCYGLQNAARQRILALGLETGDRVLQQGLAILLLWLVLGDPLMALAGYAGSAMLFWFINQHYYLKTFPETGQRPPPESLGHSESAVHYGRDILRYAWPFMLFGAFTWAQTASDRWALELLCSTESVGQYAVLNQIGFQSLSLLIGSISYFLIPILYNRAGSLEQAGQFREANRLNNWYLCFNAVLTMGLCSVFWFFGAGVVRLLSAEKYVPIASLLPIMALAGGLFNFGQTYSMRFMFGLQTQQLLYPKIGAALIGVCLNFYAVSHYGLVGLVWAAVIGQMIYLIFLLTAWQFLPKSHLRSSI